MIILKSIKTGAIAAMLLGSAIITNAQHKINQGTITYGVEYNLPAEQAAMASQLPEEQKVNFNGNILRTQMEQGPATITILQDFVEKSGLLLIDVPIAQMQYAVKMSKEDIATQEAAGPKFSDFKATGEMKKIGNYNAERYTYKDEKNGSYELWATNEIAFPAGFHSTLFKDVKGALVKYTTFQNGIKMVLTIKNVIENKVGPFSLTVPSGYELKTMQEVMAMQGGGE